LTTLLALIVENWVAQDCELQPRLGEQQAGNARVVAVNEFQFNRKPGQCALLGKTRNKLVGIPQPGLILVCRSDRRKCKRQSLITMRFKFLIEELQKPAEDVLLIRSGVVGSASRRPLSVKEFRGFVFSDPIAPLVFINGGDSTSAQVFTLAHELVHLWIGKSGVSNPNPKKRSTDEVNDIERFCNKVAAEVLVPHSEFLRRWNDNQPVETNVQTLIRHFRVSTHVILRQAFEQDKISREEYEERIQAEEDRFKAQLKAKGGSFFRNVPIRNSRILTTSVLDAIQENRVGLRDAATLLGCKVPTLKNVAAELS
jgi:Zn-dependent peptidase ImmA (M78 family)